MGIDAGILKLLFEYFERQSLVTLPWLMMQPTSIEYMLIDLFKRRLYNDKFHSSSSSPSASSRVVMAIPASVC
jgi:hypothetical protein